MSQEEQRKGRRWEAAQWKALRAVVLFGRAEAPALSPPNKDKGKNAGWKPAPQELRGAATGPKGLTPWRRGELHKPEAPNGSISRLRAARCVPRLTGSKEALPFRRVVF